MESKRFLFSLIPVFLFALGVLGCFADSSPAPTPTATTTPTRTPRPTRQITPIPTEDRSNVYSFRLPVRSGVVVLHPGGSYQPDKGDLFYKNPHPSDCYINVFGEGGSVSKGWPYEDLQTVPPEIPNCASLEVGATPTVTATP